MLECSVCERPVNPSNPLNITDSRFGGKVLHFVCRMAEYLDAWSWDLDRDLDHFFLKHDCDFDAMREDEAYQDWELKAQWVEDMQIAVWKFTSPCQIFADLWWDNVPHHTPESPLFIEEPF